MCPDAGELSSGGDDSTLIAILGGGCVTDSELILDAISSRQRQIPFVRGRSTEFTCDRRNFAFDHALLSPDVDFLQPILTRFRKSDP